MKFALTSFTLLLSVKLLAVSASPFSITCRDDQRFEDNGPLREMLLIPGSNGYLLQSQFVPSLNSGVIEIENWAENLQCHIKDELAYCQNQEGHIVAQFKERREFFYDSLEEDAKKKSSKHIDISLSENGVNKKVSSFAASHCQTFGGGA